MVKRFAVELTATGNIIPQKSMSKMDAKNLDSLTKETDILRKEVFENLDTIALFARERTLEIQLLRQSNESLLKIIESSKK